MERCPTPLSTPILDGKQIMRLLNVIDHEATVGGSSTQGGPLKLQTWTPTLYDVDWCGYMWVSVPNSLSGEWVASDTFQCFQLAINAEKTHPKTVSIVSQVLPKTAQGVKEGNKVFGAAVLRTLGFWKVHSQMDDLERYGYGSKLW